MSTKRFKDFLKEAGLSFNPNATKHELIRSGVSAKGAEKISDIVSKESPMSVYRTGSTPEFSISVYPKDALGGKKGFVIHNLDETKPKFKTIISEIRKVLESEKINFSYEKVNTGYSFQFSK